MWHSGLTARSKEETDGGENGTSTLILHGLRDSCLVNIINKIQHVISQYDANKHKQITLDKQNKISEQYKYYDLRAASRICARVVPSINKVSILTTFLLHLCLRKLLAELNRLQEEERQVQLMLCSHCGDAPVSGLQANTRTLGIHQKGQNE